MYQRYEIIGKLVADSEKRGENAPLNFRVITSKKFKKQDGSEVEKTFAINCVLWGPLGAALQKHLVKGKPVMVAGELEQPDSYEKNGETHYPPVQLNVNPDDFRFMPDGKGKASGGQQSQQSQQSQSGNGNQQQGSGHAASQQPASTPGFDGEGFDDPFADPVKF